MKAKTKVALFLAAALITLVGLSLIVSPALDMLVVGKEAGYERISNFLATSHVNAAHIPAIG